MLSAVARFRWRLQLAIMLVIGSVTLGVLFAAQHRAAAEAERAMYREFQNAVGVVRNLHALRNSALVEHCRGLVRKPRLHAALEDDALDLLYPSATDELRDVLEDERETSEQSTQGLHAEFYRFLDRHGVVIEPGPADNVGLLLPGETAQLALPGVPSEPQLGYLVRRQRDADGPIFDLIAMPIRSTENGESIAALVLGYEPASRIAVPASAGIKRGIWLGGRVYLMEVSAEAAQEVAALVGRALAAGRSAAEAVRVTIGGADNLVFFERLNPGSHFAPAYQVCLYPLAEVQSLVRKLRLQVLGIGGLVLLLGLATSHVLAGRFARPVERLAQDSEENRVQRRRAEAALEQTSEELQRAARFSADASHQLKTPVTVLRAGLEEWLTREHLTPEECHEISALIHQTYRLSSLIEDLLLLSRMDAGRLEIEFGAVNLSHLIAAALDDLDAQPNQLDLVIETDLPGEILVAGEKRYLAIILQNLLENARKYNRRGGRIRVAAHADGEFVCLTIGNTGPSIPVAAQEHIFERFHRGSMGENVPGYGLGLNLARELARLHRGELRLFRSSDDWTEFEVRFLTLPAGKTPGGEVA